MDWRKKYRPYILAGTLAFVMTMFFAPEFMEGPSMSPALDDGQGTVITKETYSANRGEPELGEMVVLEKLYSQNFTEDNIISRIAGLPGDEIVVKDGQIYRDGEVIAAAPKDAENQTIKIKKNYVYLLNDNDDPSLDSRNPEMGPVSMDEIRGDVKLIFWPFSDFGKVK